MAEIKKLTGFGGRGMTSFDQGATQPTPFTVLKEIQEDLVALRAPLAGMLSGSKTYDAASIAASGTETTTVTVTGAALGDFAEASMGVDLQGLVLTAYVSAADTVTTVLFNPTAGAIDLASTDLRVRVRPQASFASPAALKTTVEV